MITEVMFKTGRITSDVAFNPVLIPMKSRRYQPVANKELVDLVTEVSDSHGLTLTNHSYALASNGQQFFWTADVTGISIIDKIIDVQIGAYNSGNGSKTVAMCFGSKVLVCCNGMFHWTTDDNGFGGMVKHKHTSSVFTSVRERIMAAFDKLNDFTNEQSSFFQRLMEISITDAEADSIIINAVRENAVSSTKIMRVADQWRLQMTGAENEQQALESGYHVEFSKPTAYSLLNCFTQVQHEYLAKNPVESNSQTLVLNRYFRNRFLN